MALSRRLQRRCRRGYAVFWMLNPLSQVPSLPIGAIFFKTVCGGDAQMLTVENWLRFTTKLMSNPESTVNEPNSNPSQKAEFFGFATAQVAEVTGKPTLDEAGDGAKRTQFCRHFIATFWALP
jgi:hypothetical protein